MYRQGHRWQWQHTHTHTHTHTPHTPHTRHTPNAFLDEFEDLFVAGQVIPDGGLTHTPHDHTIAWCHHTPETRSAHTAHAAHTHSPRSTHTHTHTAHAPHTQPTHHTGCCRRMVHAATSKRVLTLSKQLHRQQRIHQTCGRTVRKCSICVDDCVPQLVQPCACRYTRLLALGISHFYGVWLGKRAACHTVCHPNHRAAHPLREKNAANTTCHSPCGRQGFLCRLRLPWWHHCHGCTHNKRSWGTRMQW